MSDEELYIADTTVIATGALRKALQEGSITGRLILHSLIISYFERLAREGSHRGFVGLRELSQIRELVTAKEDSISVEYVRDLPEGLRWLRDFSPDEVIRELAMELSATLITSDQICAEAARSSGVQTLYLEPTKGEGFVLDQFFSNDTMSVHLKEGVQPRAKVGKPGKWRFVQLSEDPITREELENIIEEILEYAKSNHSAFIESDKPGSMILQVGSYRIVITRPPLSDGLEVTAVRPLVRLSLEDYSLSPRLMHRLEKQAEGILIAGAPGMGKTTFAQALAEYYRRKGKIVKTIESPRDMQLPSDVTQYSKNYASSEELHDILLLSRPDYTFFDEMRNTSDFELFSDLRLAGVGMVGVVHATSPIDAIQRFIGRIELGMIPSIIDTVIFIADGEVKKVYELETVVKVPHGLREAELARPVVVVKDYLSGEPEYELYVFGDRTFVVPIKGRGIVRGEEIVKNRLAGILKKYFPEGDVEIASIEGNKVIVLVDEEYYNYVVGKPRRKIERAARRLGVEIEIRPKLSF